MSRESKHLDALIDEALQDLTAGEPREGLRGRVLARIAATPESPRPGVVNVFGWRVRPVQWVTAGALAALGLVALLLVPSLVPRGGSTAPETTSADHRPTSPAPQPAFEAQAPAIAPQVQAASVAMHTQSRPPALQSEVDTAQAQAADEEPSAIPPLRVKPLPDPDPIVNQAIHIAPVQIQELAIPEIQVRPLDAGRAKRDDK